MRLFAERGVDGITVRDIAEAAGQKNHAAVGYHFGSKEALIRELIIDGASLIDQRRNQWLDDLEADGGPRSVRQVVDILIYASLNLCQAGTEETYNRFIVLLGMSHRPLFMDVVAGRWNVGYQRCLGHLRRLMPAMSETRKNQRFVFMLGYIGSVLAMRETELADRSRDHPTWAADETLSHFAATVTALIEAP